MKQIFNILSTPLRAVKRSAAFLGVAAISLTLAFNAPGGAYYLNSAVKNLALYSMYTDFVKEHGRFASFKAFKDDLPLFLMISYDNDTQRVTETLERFSNNDQNWLCLPMTSQNDDNPNAPDNMPTGCHAVHAQRKNLDDGRKQPHPA